MKDEAYYFHQTPESLCHELVKKLDLNPTDCVFEPFAGEGNWVRSFGMDQNIIQTEIENGSDYRSIDLETKVDWIITNPPYQLEAKRENDFYKLINLFAGKTNKGIAFLGNDRCLSEFTPPRLKNLYETKGIYLHKIVVCSVKKWTGNSFFLIFKNKPSKSKPCCNGCKDKKPCESEAHHSHDHAPPPAPTDAVRFDFFDYLEGNYE